MAEFRDRLTKEMKRLLSLRWTGPFLLVPVLLVASLVTESRLQESGMADYIPVGRRSDYSVWRVVMICCLVGTSSLAVFLRESWQKLRSNSFFSMFTGSFSAGFLFLFLIMAASAFVLLLPLTVPGDFIASRAFVRAAVVAFWSLSTACLCSSITSGAGAAVFSLGLFCLGLFPGLAGTSMGWWFSAPLGDMVRGVPGAVPAVLGHGLFYLLFSVFVLKKTTR